MINSIIVHHETEVTFLLGFIASVHHLCQLLFGDAYLVGIVPGVTDTIQHGNVGQQRRIGGVIVVHPLGIVGGKHVHTDFSFRLIAVGSKPAQVVEIVDGIHVIVKGGVER